MNFNVRDNSCHNVNLLLVDKSNERVGILYNGNSHIFKLPKIGPRPPYYCNPKCSPYYPTI